MRGTLDLSELSQLAMNCECLSESMLHLGTFMAMSTTNSFGGGGESLRRETNQLFLIATSDPLIDAKKSQRVVKLNAASVLASLVFDVQYRMRDYMKVS